LVKFSLGTGECLTFTLSLEVIPVNIAIRDISLKLHSLGYISAAESVYLQSLLRKPPRKLPNSVKLCSRYGYYAV